MVDGVGREGVSEVLLSMRLCGGRVEEWLYEPMPRGRREEEDTELDVESRRVCGGRESEAVLYLLEGMRLREEEDWIMVPGTAAQLMLLPLLSSEALESILPWPAPLRWDGAWARSRYKRDRTGESGRPSLEPPRTVEPPSSESSISEGISAGQFGSGVESSERITSGPDD